MNSRAPIVIFDFDCTLTYAHWYYFLHMFDHFITHQHWMQGVDVGLLRNTRRDIMKVLEDENVLSTRRQVLIDFVTLYFFGGVQRLEIIKNTLSRLDDMGCRLFIASRGNCDEIRSLLRWVGLIRFFEMQDTVNISAYQQPCINLNKDLFILDLHQRYPLAHIFYIDDDDREHRELISSGEIPPNMYTYMPLPKNQNGLTHPQLISLQQQIITHMD